MMRESKPFGQRTKIKKSDVPNIKYFIFCEGTQTELIYFNQLKNMAKEIGLNPIIELSPMIRSYTQSGKSNPKTIVELANSFLEQLHCRTLSYNTLINYIIDFCIEEKLISKKSSMFILNQLKDICKNKYCGTNLDTDVNNLKECCQEMLGEIIDVSSIKITDYVEQIIEAMNIEYIKEIDKVCFIVDRDKCSFTVDQFNDVLNKCKEKGYKFYMSNPCFEFWLLLHFEAITSIDKDKLANNTRITEKRRFAEDELKKLYPTYKKTNYNACKFIKKIDTAIANEKLFCENIEQLENSVGCNIGLLMTELKQD